MTWKRQYTIGSVARASGVSAKTIRQWDRRGRLVGTAPTQPDGKYSPRHFSENAAIEIAIIGALTSHGFDARDAAEAATTFAHMAVEDTQTGGAAAAWEGGTVTPRRPGELFETGWTVLFVANDNTARVANTREVPGDLMMKGPVTAVEMSSLVMGVRAALQAEDDV